MRRTSRSLLGKLFTPHLPAIVCLTDSMRVVRRSSVLVGYLHSMHWLPRVLMSQLEGIGLVIPITDAMKEPRKFPKVLSGVMIFLIREWTNIPIY